MRHVRYDFLDIFGNRFHRCGLHFQDQGGLQCGKIDFIIMEAESDVAGHQVGQVDHQDFFFGVRAKLLIFMVGQNIDKLIVKFPAFEQQVAETDMGFLNIGGDRIQVEVFFL